MHTLHTCVVGTRRDSSPLRQGLGILQVRWWQALKACFPFPSRSSMLWFLSHALLSRSPRQSRVVPINDTTSAIVLLEPVDLLLPYAPMVNDRQQRSGRTLWLT